MSGENVISVESLLGKCDAGEPFLLLDVRNDEEYDAWKIEGRRPVEVLHIPYFDFVEDPGVVSRVPSGGREVLVLCAKGGSSEFVAEMLRDAGVGAKSVEGGMVAYGAYLQTTRVPLAAGGARHHEIVQVNRRGKGCLSYLVHGGGEAVVVDPSRDAGAYERLAAEVGARIVWVLDTHIHADHLSGGPDLARSTGARYFVAAGPGFDLEQEAAPLADGQEIRLGSNAGAGVAIRVVSTPGHTPGSTSFLVDGRFLLTGDTLFVAGVGRPDLGGHVFEWSEDLFDTLHERLAGLPDDVVVLPAHYSRPSEMGKDGVVAGRLGEIRRSVPEMKIRGKEEFADAMNLALSTPPPSYARIIQANLGAARPGAEEAVEWELGRNQCAASGH